MSLGRRPEERQGELWVATGDLARGPGHVFYDRLEGLLRAGDFDDFVEDLCEPHYAERGRRGIPPGVYFRMLFVGYFEDIDSQRGIAWRCADSLSLKAFLGLGPTERVPDHSSLTRIRDRLPLEVHGAVFRFVLELARKHRLLSGRTAHVDATTLEANAAMRSIVRRDTGEDWETFVRGLMVEAGEAEDPDEPTDEDVRRFDKKRKGKRTSNAKWESPTDGDARIIKMKDGRTHLAYKAEHVVDGESEFLLHAGVYHADRSDGGTLPESLDAARETLEIIGAERTVEEAVADKGYHGNAALVACEERGVRTYLPEQRRAKRRKWTDKPPETEAAYRANRRRTKGERGRRLQRRRSEITERSFAHVCETGGARRSWLRGLEKVDKRYGIVAAAHNLGLLMRAFFGAGKPRAASAALHSWSSALRASLARLGRRLVDLARPIQRWATERHNTLGPSLAAA